MRYQGHAKEWKYLFEIYAFGDHQGIKVRMPKRQVFPETVGGVVYLPHGLDRQQLIKSFLHELQHALDYKEGLDLELTREEMEIRARRAEKRYELYQ